MAGEEKKTMKNMCKHHAGNTASWGTLSFVTYVGAAVYFISITDGGFWVVIWALIKAMVWPAFVVFHVLQALGA